MGLGGKVSVFLGTLPEAAGKLRNRLKKQAAACQQYLPWKTRIEVLFLDLIILFIENTTKMIRTMVVRED